MTTNCEWRDVVGFPGYQVNNAGQMRSIDRWIMRAGHPAYIRGVPMKLQRLHAGHLEVKLRRNNKSIEVKVHRAVLEAFVGPCPPGMECCHNDGDPANNNLSNLRWDTHTSNVADIIEHGNNVNLRKSYCPRGHAYSPENTYLCAHRKRGRIRPARLCRQCRRDRLRDRRQQRRAVSA